MVKKFKEVINKKAEEDRKLREHLKSNTIALEVNEMELFQFSSITVFKEFDLLLRRLGWHEDMIFFENHRMLEWISDVVNDGSLPPDFYEDVTEKIIKTKFIVITPATLDKLRQDLNDSADHLVVINSFLDRHRVRIV